MIDDLYSGIKDGFLEYAGILFGTKTENDSVDKNLSKNTLVKNQPVLEKLLLVTINYASYHNVFNKKITNFCGINL